MRPIRPVILLSTTLLFTACLLYLSLTTATEDYAELIGSTSKGGSMSAWFSFRNPATLFTPTATISLIDDNSTYFAARPAAFGPLLPEKGLSGEVWLGSGFADSYHGRRGILDSAEGELGCSDIPGWWGRRWPGRGSISSESTDSRFSSTGVEDRDDDDPFDGPLRQHYNPPEDPEQSSNYNPSVKEDGTDNYLHFPLEGTYIHTTDASSQRRPSSPNSKSTKSNPDRPDIVGKVVLLSRGGCGFAEKVKWAQRRGATAVIVGDNIRGGPLVRMYARGDTSNITIPSLFTSHTSAHLISSLVPASYYAGDANHETQPIITKERRKPTSHEPGETTRSENAGMFYAMWSTLRLRQRGKLERRTDSVRASKYDQTVDTTSRNKLVRRADRDVDQNTLGITTTTFAHPSYPTSPPELDKGGVHSMLPDDSEKTTSNDSSDEKNDLDNHSKGRTEKYPNNLSPSDPSNHFGLPYDRLWPGGEDRSVPDYDRITPEHPGLWVTLTPTNMSTSPFFNTLFVLVVSPLVTLAVVYSMLLLRSRIRRRRWRAPKSVVERLPVRIYRVLSNRSGSSNGSGASGGPSQTTPLLGDGRASESTLDPQQVHQQSAPQSPQMSTNYGSLARAPPESEKSESGLSQWKRRYGGKQVECVVCLEEYVDGVSRVMSLPCGHEFHVDCITPWLTTRRRTCPICKGDVVRSLGRDGACSISSSASEDFDEEAIQDQAARRTNRSPSSFLPIPQLPPQLAVEAVRDGEGPSSTQSAPQTRSYAWLQRGSTRGVSALGRGALPSMDIGSDEEDLPDRSR